MLSYPIMRHTIANLGNYARKLVPHYEWWFAQFVLSQKSRGFRATDPRGFYVEDNPPGPSLRFRRVAESHLFESLPD
jgi:hypothetical protein